jgi:hypothetical protein
MKVSIDTNIFLHLFNDRENEDEHIDALLTRLAGHGAKLCVDSTNKIANEYHKHLDGILRKDDDGLRIYILRRWMNEEFWDNPIATDPKDVLMNRIKGVIPGNNQRIDRIFVYVSCVGNCALVTNCATHILSRRTPLRARTRRFRGPESNILSSQEARVHFSEENLRAFADEL